MSASDSVSVEIQVADSASPQVENLSTPMVAAYHTHYAARFKLYEASGGAGLAEMITDGFLVKDAAYKAALAICAQNPSPAFFAIGRRAIPPQQTLHLTCNDGTIGDSYNLTIVGGTDGTSHALSYTVPPNYGGALTGTVALVSGNPDITFSTTQTLAAGGFLVFGAQAGVWYALAGAVSSTPGVLTANYTGTSAPTSTVTYVAPLAGTFDAVNGASAIPSTSNQTGAIAVGDSVMFASQLGTYYTVTAVSSSVVTLESPYTGVTAGTTTAGDVSTVASAAAALEALVVALPDVGTVSLTGNTIAIARTDGNLNDVQGWRANGFANLELEDVTTDSGGIASDLEAIFAANSSDWYSLALDSNSKAEALAAALIIEATGQGGKEFFTNTSDWGNGQSTVTNDVFSEIQAVAYKKTHIQQNNSQLLCYAGASTAAFSGARNPGSYAFAQGMTLPGVPADTETTLPEAEALVINGYTAQTPTQLGKGGNFYKVTAGIDMSFWGFAPNGNGAPLWIFIDWLYANAQADVLGVLAGLPKVPFTDFGLGLIGDAIDNRLRIGASALYGGIDGTEPIVVTVPSAASISPESKAVFNAPGFAFTASYESSIESVTIDGTLIN